jgi:hypothetical protein
MTTRVDERRLCLRDLVGVCDCRLAGWTWGGGWTGVTVTPHPDSMCEIGAAGDGAASNEVWITLFFTALLCFGYDLVSNNSRRVPCCI